MRPDISPERGVRWGLHVTNRGSPIRRIPGRRRAGGGRKGRCAERTLYVSPFFFSSALIITLVLVEAARAGTTTCWQAAGLMAAACMVLVLVA